MRNKTRDRHRAGQRRSLTKTAFLRRKLPKVDASIFDSALSPTRTRRKKKEDSVSTFRRFRLWTSFGRTPVSVNPQIGVKRAAPDSGVIAVWNLQAFRQVSFNKGSDNLQEI